MAIIINKPREHEKINLHIVKIKQIWFKNAKIKPSTIGKANNNIDTLNSTKKLGKLK